MGVKAVLRITYSNQKVNSLKLFLDDESEEESEEEQVEGESKADKARNRILKRRAHHEANRNLDHLRAPVVCVLGKIPFSASTVNV